MAKENKTSKDLGNETFSDLLASEEPFVVDLHTHSIGSFDGSYQIEHMLWEANGKGLSALAVTDHNTLEECYRFLRNSGRPTNSAYIKSNGVFFVPGVEITCRDSRVLNKKGNSCKLHIGVYGGFDENGPLARVLKLKAENDRLYDFGKLDYVLSEIGMEEVVSNRIIKEFVSRKKLVGSGFNTMGGDDVAEFFVFLGSLTEKEMGMLGLPNSRIEEIQAGLSRAGLVIKSNKGLHALQEKLRLIYEKAPNVQRINLEVGDIIKLAHYEGLITDVKHPWSNIPRTIHQKELVTSLLDYGVDGFEIAKENDNGLVRLITSCIQEAGKEEEIIYTSGSDLHDFSKGNGLGKTGKGKKITVDTPEFIRFFEYLEERQKSIERGEKFKSDISDEEVEKILEKYTKQAEDCIESKPIKNVVQKEKHKEPKQKQKTKRVEDMTPEELAQFEEKRRRDLENASKSKPKNKDLITIHLKGGKTFIINAIKTPMSWLEKMPKEFFTPEEYNAVAEFLASDRMDDSMLERAGVFNPNNATTNTPPTDNGYGEGM